MKLYRKGTALEEGFALITAIMMLFAATVMGLMVMNSSEIEIILSGAQQRYEDNFNVADGGMTFEAAAVGRAQEISIVATDGTTETRSYSVSNPEASGQTLSPVSGEEAYDPGDDIEEDVAFVEDNSETWPMFNLLRSTDNQDDRFDYRYKVIFAGSGTSIPKGYSAEKFTNYQFEIAASRTTEIEVGGNKIGPKIGL
jgi:hypothetical protein